MSTKKMRVTDIVNVAPWRARLLAAENDVRESIQYERDMRNGFMFITTCYSGDDRLKQPHSVVTIFSKKTVANGTYDKTKRGNDRELAFVEHIGDHNTQDCVVEQLWAQCQGLL